MKRLLLLVGLLAVGCRRRGEVPRPVVVKIEVRDRSRDAVLDRAALTQTVGEALRKSGLFEVSLDPARAQTAASWRCRADVGAGADAAGEGGVLHAAARVDCGPLSGQGSETLSAQTLGDKPYKTGEGGVETLLRAHAAQLLADTVGLVVQQRRLAVGPPSALVAALGDGDADVRRMAIRAAGARKSKEAVPALIHLLDDGQEDVREMALGALFEIRDPQAVKAITSRVKFQNTDDLRRIIDPVASMGGEEARAFLEFVASGHEDADIRKQARTALDRMERTRPAP